MTREQLEHILRAAAGITGGGEFVIIGSQAILGEFPNAPSELLASMEADVFSLQDPRAAELIDGSIGEESPFHRTFGYYAHGVGVETAKLPEGWGDRLITVNSPATGGATGLCLEAHDLAVSKLVAGREHDLSFVAAMVRHQMISPATLRERVEQTTLDEPTHRRCLSQCDRLAGYTA